MKTIAELYDLYIRFTADLMTLELNVSMHGSLGTVLNWAISFGTIPSLVLIGAATAHARLDRGPRRARYYFVVASQLVPFLMFAAAVVFSLAVSYDYEGQESRSGLASNWERAFSLCPFVLMAGAALFRGYFALRFALLLTVPASVALQATIWDVLYPHHLELLSTSAPICEEPESADAASAETEIVNALMSCTPFDLGELAHRRA